LKPAFALILLGSVALIKAIEMHAMKISFFNWLTFDEILQLAVSYFHII